MTQSTQQWIDGLKVQAEHGISPDKGDREFLRSVRQDERAAARAARKASPMHGSTSWENLETSHKVNAGISGACAVMAAFSTLSAMKNSVTRDMEGQAHVQWSQVGVAFLQGAIAAGCAFFTVEALKGRSVF